MIDFLRSNTWCSQNEYKWYMTVPQIRLASMDFTHIEYLSDEEKKKNSDNSRLKNATVVDGAKGMKKLNDLGIPII